MFQTARARGFETTKQNSAAMEDFPAWLNLAPDARVLGLTTILAGVSACLFGTAPALQLSGEDPIIALKDGRIPCRCLTTIRMAPSRKLSDDLSIFEIYKLSDSFWGE